MITVVDYGMGNISSIVNMVQKCGAIAEIADAPEALNQANKIILPGVGAFDHGVSQLHERGLWDTLKAKVENEHTPILGICLGMQLFGVSSEEGRLPGLGLISGRVLRLHPASPTLKVPHMGWETVQTCCPSVLLKNLHEGSRFYFAHSYHLVCNEKSDVVATVEYGETVTAVVEKGHIFGVQFHPEKSHRFGLHVLRNFVELA